MLQKTLHQSLPPEPGAWWYKVLVLSPTTKGMMLLSHSISQQGPVQGSTLYNLCATPVLLTKMCQMSRSCSRRPLASAASLAAFTLSVGTVLYCCPHCLWWNLHGTLLSVAQTAVSQARVCLHSHSSLSQLLLAQYQLSAFCLSLPTSVQVMAHNKGQGTLVPFCTKYTTRHMAVTRQQLSHKSLSP